MFNVNSTVDVIVVEVVELFGVSQPLSEEIDFVVVVVVVVVEVNTPWISSSVTFGMVDKSIEWSMLIKL